MVHSTARVSPPLSSAGMSRAAAALAALALLLAPGAASALTVLAADLPDLTVDSAVIVHGAVTSVRNVVLDAEGGEVDEATLAALDKNTPPHGLRAFTDVQVRPLAWHKGRPEADGAVHIRLIGGTIGPYRIAVPGMPSFVPGEEVVLFLEVGGLGFVPVGAGQGVFRIRRDSGEAIAHQDLGGAAVLRRDVVPAGCRADQLRTAGCEARTAPGLPAIPSAMPLDVLIGQIRAVLGLPASPAAPVLERKNGLITR